MAFHLFLLSALLWVEEGLGCFKCFISRKERVEICDFVFEKQRLDAEICNHIMMKTFLPLDTYVIAMSQTETVRKAMKGFYDEVKKQYTQAKKPMECIPPCGLQEQARKFNCMNCEEEHCKLPIECPIEDIYVHEFRTVVMNCSTGFPLPMDDITVLWKFHWQVRTRRWSRFKALHRGMEFIFLITRMVLDKEGTYACEISTDEDVLIRKYFFVNVTYSSLRESIRRMEQLFNMIVNSNTTEPPTVKPRKWIDLRRVFNPKKSLSMAEYILYTAIVAMATVLLVLIVGGGCFYIYR
ncbi:sperm acrosome membrane-associated protein 6 [Xenopus tropicalis]|uniref:Sperm acrosome membrane-associated protein 6 n=1 Tax=Xenopus tropicalis TaxID=8364 RepID=A0A8J1K0U5_XENTR|nr:sperm acrosome membrane-associated protein 6 [Xenopus tropicalis]